LPIESYLQTFYLYPTAERTVCEHDYALKENKGENMKKADERFCRHPLHHSSATNGSSLSASHG
jgi:hypothetical protein